ncbi:MAG: DMT family transporter, partial [Alphaproteobacteria bacterium]
MAILSSNRQRSAAQAAMPALFVLLWSSGFVGAKYGLPYAEPFTFLLLRFTAVIAVLLVVALLQRAPWPASWSQAGHIAVAGLLVQGVYLGGCFVAFKIDIPAGVVALIVGIQPLLTAAVVGPLLGERVARHQWFGLALGFLGVMLVVSRTLSFERVGLEGLAASLVALVAITAGMLYQKKYCAGLDLRTGVIIQYGAAAILMALLSTLFEQQRVDWTLELVLALLWLSLVLSVGAVFLLFVMIRRGAAARVASLFYLVPPVTAFMAYLLFGETMGATALAGMICAVIGVA